jgi:hypothetical protein
MAAGERVVFSGGEARGGGRGSGPWDGGGERSFRVPLDSGVACWEFLYGHVSSYARYVMSRPMLTGRS